MIDNNMIQQQLSATDHFPFFAVMQREDRMDGRYSMQTETVGSLDGDDSNPIVRNNNAVYLPFPRFSFMHVIIMNIGGLLSVLGDPPNGWFWSYGCMIFIAFCLAIWAQRRRTTDEIIVTNVVRNAATTTTPHRLFWTTDDLDPECVRPTLSPLFADQQWQHQLYVVPLLYACLVLVWYITLRLSWHSIGFFFLAHLVWECLPNMVAWWMETRRCQLEFAMSEDYLFFQPAWRWKPVFLSSRTYDNGIQFRLPAAINLPGQWTGTTPVLVGVELLPLCEGKDATSTRHVLELLFQAGDATDPCVYRRNPSLSRSRSGRCNWNNTAAATVGYHLHILVPLGREAQAMAFVKTMRARLATVLAETVPIFARSPDSPAYNAHVELKPGALLIVNGHGYMLRDELVAHTVPSLNDFFLVAVDRPLRHLAAGRAESKGRSIAITDGDVIMLRMAEGSRLVVNARTLHVRNGTLVVAE